MIFDQGGERIQSLAKEAGFNLAPTANMLYTVRGNHAQLENFARLVIAAAGAQAAPVAEVRGAMVLGKETTMICRLPAGEGLPVGTLLYAAGVLVVDEPKENDRG